jgi:uncharacterized membrane protein
MVAAGLWIGGLVLLGLLLREARDADDPVGAAPVREVRRFSNVALVAVGVVVATGIARSFTELGGFGAAADLLDSTYGRTLVAKVLAALALIAMGAVNRRRSIPRLAADPRPLRRMAGAELVVALGVIVLTATLTSAAPNSGTTPTPPSPPVTAEGTDFATTTAVALTLAPGAPGPSTVEVEVTDPDTGDLLPVDDVALRVRSVTRPDVPAESIVLAAQGDAWTATTSTFSLAGTWAATAIVTTGAEAVQVPLVVVTRIPDATTSVEVGPGLPTVTTTTFAGGTSIQTYVDPAVAGTNQIHATAFTPEGTEASLDDTTIVAIPDGGEPRRLDVIDFGPGHVVANVGLEAGDWTFDVVATTGDGTALQATFDETIEAT